MTPQQAEVLRRATEWLSNGGFFNPSEMAIANSDGTRELILSLRGELAAALAAAPQPDPAMALRERAAKWREGADECERRGDTQTDDGLFNSAIRMVAKTVAAVTRVHAEQLDELAAAVAPQPDPDVEKLKIEVETLRELLTAWQKRCYEAEQTNPHGTPVDPALLEPFKREMQEHMIPAIVAAVTAETRHLPIGAAAASLPPQDTPPDLARIREGLYPSHPSDSPSITVEDGRTLLAAAAPQPQKDGASREAVYHSTRTSPCTKQDGMNSQLPG